MQTEDAYLQVRVRENERGPAQRATPFDYRVFIEELGGNGTLGTMMRDLGTAMHLTLNCAPLAADRTPGGCGALDLLLSRVYRLIDVRRCAGSWQLLF